MPKKRDKVVFETVAPKEIITRKKRNRISQNQKINCEDHAQQETVNLQEVVNIQQQEKDTKDQDQESNQKKGQLHGKNKENENSTRGRKDNRRHGWIHALSVDANGFRNNKEESQETVQSLRRDRSSNDSRGISRNRKR
ncbi:hypothetical protein K7X08_005057 [Anisodus acutangulus]|uniref:Uncharacterized protein n=1 Tax=Anisodus acutangulus TaxID=402998 RepID=A0A9Q1MHQ6_9SOLA|nr:hypothetical protein K7X08_005057 [Anisodus acutangulus]